MTHCDDLIDAPMEGEGKRIRITLWSVHHGAHPDTGRTWFATQEDAYRHSDPNYAFGLVFEHDFDVTDVTDICRLLNELNA